ncbi:hypothetical protein [Stigmatella aurantiaca]|uniref:Conserved uncharacterized protein n=1 Tax=Stigmatella aurantiaca (strain DW4/3-1) TaxID=378806 RepID=Q08Y19_STIAD|nr:hypothetical protein [Stigmatella aurantiaca]ADO69976.1 conserved uncharacterized protein [Stigmatella aurantiaca DW4/3-1]EAU65386.1 hypothetical protein STIAU_2174 [Stigmatella aurantiaca DW4/3-1]
MKNTMRRGTKWTRWVPVLGTLALASLSTGCGEECTHSSDCQDTPERSDPSNPYVCREEKCVPLYPGGAPPDAGPGTDAGPNTDGGTDAGPDTDGGTDAGPDTDGGTDAGPDTDGGTDGGTDPCAVAPHDPKLGTLQLQAGFTATESSGLPAGIIAVTAVGPGPLYTVYGLSGADQNVYPLGTWPSLQPSTQALFSVIEPSDRGGSFFLGGYLVNDGSRLLSGYTKSGANFPGYVSLFQTTAPTHLQYLSAPGNYTVAALPNAFLINGLGLGSSPPEVGIYALQPQTDPPTTSLLATFDPAWEASSGYTAVTENGVAVLGYFDGTVFTNRLRAAAPSLYQPALTSHVPFSLADATELTPGSSILNVAAFGDGVALLLGDDSGWPPVYTDVSRIELALSSGTPQTVTPGATTPVLKFVDSCTQLQSLTELGGDLLVGVSDKNGERLVRIHQP